MKVKKAHNNTKANSIYYDPLIRL